METETHGEISCIRSKRYLKFSDHHLQLFHALKRELCHNYGMVGLGLREASDCKVGVANSFYFEDFTTLRQNVERLIDCLKEQKYLSRFARGTPSSETGDVGEVHSAVGKEVRNRLATTVICFVVACEKRLQPLL